MALRNRLALLILLSLAPAAGLAQTDILAGFLPVVGSLNGDLGSRFETTVQLVNPNFNTMNGHLVFHPTGQIAQSTDPSLPFLILPHGTESFEDVVAAMGLQGLGTMDVNWDGRDLKPVVVARIFNEEGSDQMENQETHGCNEDFVTLVPGGPMLFVSGILSGPISMERFRFNVGVRVPGPYPVHLQVYVHNRQGDLVHTVSKDYPVGYFQQVSVTDFLEGFEIGDDFSLEINTAGPVIVYGATVDNRTNSPSLQVMPYVQVTG